MSYSDVLGHRDMAFDPVKNAGYMAALDAWITPDTVVLDLGCGLASHGLYAARLGARHVYLVDPEIVVDVAREVAAANGLADRVTAIRGRIEEIDLPEQVDLIITVFTGNLLYSEDLLPSLYLARDRWLRPGGRLLPDRAELRLAPVSAPEAWQREIGDWDAPKYGIDYRLLRRYAPNTFGNARGESDALTLLAPSIAVEAADFHRATETVLDTRSEFVVETSGDCHALLGWIRFRVGETWLETGPKASMHWTPHLMWLDPPVAVVPGDRMQASLLRRTWGDWTWSVSLGDQRRRHSTFLAQPLSASRLAGAASGAAAPLNADGEVAHAILTGFAQGQSNASVAEVLLERFPKRYPFGAEQALQEVKGFAIAYRGPR